MTKRKGRGYTLPGGHGAGFFDKVKSVAKKAAKAAADHVIAEVKKDPKGALAKARAFTGLGGRRKKRKTPKGGYAGVQTPLRYPGCGRGGDIIPPRAI